MPIDESALKTGDLLLCHSGPLPKPASWGQWLLHAFTSTIDLFTASPYSHAAIVLRDPHFLPEPIAGGLYVWESSYEAGVPDPQDGRSDKIGVRITPLSDFIASYAPHGRIVHRALVGRNVELCLSNERLRTVHDVVYDKPYDLHLKDWVAAALHPRAPYPCTTERFWCSAFVAYVYAQCGVLRADTQWTTMRPCDFDLTTDEALRYVCEESARLEERVSAVL